MMMPVSLGWPSGADRALNGHVDRAGMATNEAGMIPAGGRLVTSFNVHRFAGALVVAGTLVSFAEGATPAQPAPKPTIQSVLNAWEQRQKRVQSFRFSWEGTDWYNRGLIPGAEPSADPMYVFPDSDASFKTRGSFAMDAQGRRRYEHFSMAWNPVLGKLAPASQISVADGRTLREFYPDGLWMGIRGPRPYPTGSIQKGDPPAWSYVDLWPLTLVFRPLDKRFHMSAGSLYGKKPVLTDREVTVDGRTCLVIEQGRKEYWVDPARSYLPLRVVETTRVVTPEKIDLGDVITFQIAIQYSEDKEAGWIPVAWKTEISSRTDTEMLFVQSARVTEWQVNRPIPESTFQLAFPPGTFVFVQPMKEEYILRADGTRRLILPGEFNGKNYEELRDSEPPARPK
jgi:hypothetical protein